MFAVGHIGHPSMCGSCRSENVHSQANQTVTNMVTKMVKRHDRPYQRRREVTPTRLSSVAAPATAKGKHNTRNLGCSMLMPDSSGRGYADYMHT